MTKSGASSEQDVLKENDHSYTRSSDNKG